MANASTRTEATSASRDGRDEATAQPDVLSSEGCVKLGSVLSPEDTAALREETGRLLSGTTIPFSEYQKHKNDDQYITRVYSNSDWTVGTDIVGWSPRLDGIVGKIMSHRAVKGTIEGVLGPGYKMWQVNVRRHESGSEGQPLHQDAKGGLCLSVLVSDTPDLRGATIFLPRSHRWPIEYSDIGVTLRPEPARGRIQGATGKSGDAAIFFNRTWHGRYPGNVSATALLISVFRVGSTYPMHATPRPILDKLHPELQRLLDPERGIRRLEGNEVLVVDEEDASKDGPVRDELRYALHGPGPAPTFSAWRLVRGWSAGRRMLIDAVGRERLRKLRSALT